jgi:hypothetical protein
MREMNLLGTKFMYYPLVKNMSYCLQLQGGVGENDGCQNGLLSEYIYFPITTT